MTDFAYDIINEDLVIENGDFVITQDASVQNGFILLQNRGFNIANPIMGVGLAQTINAPLAQLQAIGQTWKTQTKSDGASTANFNVSLNNNIGVINITKVIY
jgi:hypothetical protein